MQRPGQKPGQWENRTFGWHELLLLGSLHGRIPPEKLLQVGVCENCPPLGLDWLTG